MTFGRYLFLTGACLVLVFVVLEPQASAGLSFGARLLFWAAHVGIGLLILELVTRGLSRFGGGLPRALLVLAAAGVVGSLLLSPIAVATESILGQPEPSEQDGPFEAALESAGLGGRILAEALDIAPGATLCWILINVPWLLRIDFSGQALAEPDPAPQPEATRALGFLDRLPDALGHELVAISSELHYLRVYTTRGETLVLYTLREALAELEGVPGERIHRSHWVAREHVVRVRREGRRANCVLSNELVLPVSRTYQPRILKLFGDRARYRT